MKYLSRIALVALSLILALPVLSARELHIVPQPSYVDIADEGEFVVTPKTKIVVVDDPDHPGASESTSSLAFFVTPFQSDRTVYPRSLLASS